LRAVSEEKEVEEEKTKEKRYESKHQLKVRTYHLLSILTTKSK